MVDRALAPFSVLAGCLLLSAVAHADTVYKYRRADGRIVYSSTPIPGLELIESVEHKYPPVAPPRESERKAAAESEERIRTQQDRLQAAWDEVQEARRALAAAEERLRLGSEEQEGDRIGVVTGAAPPAVGGVPRTQRPAAGGTMRGATRTRPSPEYVARVEALENDVKAARARLDEALRTYNQLR
jgi:hypothetical protein